MHGATSAQQFPWQFPPNLAHSFAVVKANILKTTAQEEYVREEMFYTRIRTALL